jgi:hypothetical protein
LPSASTPPARWQADRCASSLTGTDSAPGSESRAPRPSADIRARPSRQSKRTCPCCSTRVPPVAARHRGYHERRRTGCGASRRSAPGDGRDRVARPAEGRRLRFTRPNTASICCCQETAVSSQDSAPARTLLTRTTGRCSIASPRCLTSNARTTTGTMPQRRTGPRAQTRQTRCKRWRLSVDSTTGRPDGALASFFSHKTGLGWHLHLLLPRPGWPVAAAPLAPGLRPRRALLPPVSGRPPGPAAAPPMTGWGGRGGLHGAGRLCHDHGCMWKLAGSRYC